MGSLRTAAVGHVGARCRRLRHRDTRRAIVVACAQIQASRAQVAGHAPIDARAGIAGRA